MPKRSAAGVQIKTPTTIGVMAKGVLYAYFLSLVVFLIVSALVRYTPLTEAVLSYITYATALIAIFIGAAYVSKRLETRGWLNGGITGLIYLGGLLLFAFVLLPEFQIHFGYFSKVFLAFATGAAGGIFGINS
jgi:putative membrane protein (TIGR04086 family)